MKKTGENAGSHKDDQRTGQSGGKREKTEPPIREPRERLVLIRMIREPAGREEKDKNRTTHKRTAGKAGSHKDNENQPTGEPKV